MRDALFFPLSRHWRERVGVRVACKACPPSIRVDAAAGEAGGVIPGFKSGDEHDEKRRTALWKGLSG